MDRRLKILYAEDNRITARETTEALEENGYEVRTVYDGNAAWAVFRQSRPDVVLLDYQMPFRTGHEVFRLIREIDPVTPVLILSSYTELCAASLKVGTSDFIRKDGGIEEVCARIEATWKRRAGIERPDDTPVQKKTYTLTPATTFDPNTNMLTIAGEKYPLKQTVAEIFEVLCSNFGRQLTHQMICKKIWNNDAPAKIRLLQDYISQLHKYLAKDKSICLKSTYAKGYCLCLHSNDTPRE